ncbi:MAG TPA: GNAT family N-acetyltransferase [Polyangiaceae bacterium]|nr:GNAT family N-acetyltransferase [Polyangiaceae bacterium]
MAAPPEPLTLRVLDRIADLPQPAWDALVGPDDSPFVRYAWLATLEEAGCIEPRLGWRASHLTLWRGERLVAAAPAYLKGNSEGEFVFDHGWARAAAQARIKYYPKLIVAVPFTPATGARLLVPPGPDREALQVALAAGARKVAEELGLSGVHVLFAQPGEVAALEAAGLALRYGVQFHWKNRGYGSYDDFLATFNAKRRHQLKRERRESLASGLRYETLRGRDLSPEAKGAMLRFYQGTADRYYPWTRRYLTDRFFELAYERMPESVEVVLASDGGRPIAGAFNVAGSGRLYGRYWGADEARPFLHFHVCYYHSIEDCIARGLAVFEPGAGGEHKLPRGFEPTLTYSAHALTDPRLDDAVRRHLEAEREAVQRSIEQGDGD